MLILYSSNTLSFSNLGLGVLRDFYNNPTITEVLNGEYNLEFEYVTGGWLSDNLVKGNIIKANGQLFRIWDVEQDLNKIKILAKHIFFDLSKNFLVDVSPTNLTANNAISWLLSRTATANSFSVTGNCTDVASARYVRKNVIDAIYNEDNAVLKKFGGEIELNNFNIYVHKKRGNDSGFTILYGKNLNGIQMSLDLSTVATRIMPQGTNELLLDELYVDSPLINNYFTPFYQKIEFDIGIDEDNNIDESTAKNMLRAEVQKLYTEGIDKPTVSIKINFIELSKTTEYKNYQNLESVSLGDTVTAKIPKLNLDLETRVVKTVYDLILDRIITIECGTVTPNIVTNQFQSNQELSNKLAKVDTNSILTQAQINATNLINHPFGGYIYISTDTGELYIMDSDDPTTATQVWKWGLGGLGFSSNGISGPYGIAITQDGRINADYITTGTLSASVIEGYSNLLIQVNQIINSVTEVESENYIHLENAMEGQLQELTIQGLIDLLYPTNFLYPSNNIYPLDTYLIVDKSINLTANAKKYHLPFNSLKKNETFKYSKGKCYLIDENENVDALDDLEIELFEGDNYIYLESFPKSSLLPDGYTQVDYIEGSGTQYIDTGYLPTPTTKIESSFQFTQTTLQTRVYANASYETNGLVMSFYINGGGKLAWACQNDAGNWTDTGILADTNKHVFIIDGLKNKVYVDDNEFNITQTHTNNSNQSLLIFVDRTREYDARNFAYAKIYNLKVYENNVLVRDMIPCYRNSDNEVGLYDIVNNVFYTNQGTGAFTYGSTYDIDLTAKYVVKNEYTDVFSTKTEMYSAINQTAETIDLKLEKKTDNDSIIAQINMSTEKDQQGSYIGIKADKLSFEGATIDMTADDVKIQGENLSIDSDGIITLKDNSAANALQSETLQSAYIIESEDTIVRQGTTENLKFKNQIIANGRRSVVEDSWEYEGTTGGGIGGINEFVYSQPRITLFSQSNDYDASSGTGTYDSLDVSLYGGISYSNISSGTTSTPLSITSSGRITCVSLTQTSKEENKKNFEKLTNAKEILDATDIYKYNFKDEENNIKKSIGFVIGNDYNYSEEITSIDNDGVNIYSMVSVLWQVVKEQQEEINKLKEMINNGIYQNNMGK